VVAAVVAAYFVAILHLVDLAEPGIVEITWEGGSGTSESGLSGKARMLEAAQALKLAIQKVKLRFSITTRGIDPPHSF
jgi:hypothetical protein